MPRKKQVDGKKLIEAIKSGKPSTEVMKKFGLKTSAQLKAAYADALMDAGAAPPIVTKRGKGKSTAPDKTTRVNKRGSIVIPREVVEEMGFKEGTEFSIRKTKSGVSLKEQKD